MKNRKQTVAALLPIAALIVITGGVYLNALFNGFVYDDNDNILANPWIRDLTLIPEMFSRSSMEFMGLVANTYRPILHLAFNIEYHVFGTHPFGYHLVAVLLHILNTLAVFFVAGRILRNEGRPLEGAPWTAPFLAAAVFGLHPMNTESVAWISAVPELVFTLLFLSALYVHLTTDHRGLPGPVATGALYFAALMAKETAIMLLPVLLAYDLIFRGKGVKESWRTYLACAVGGGLYMALRMNAVGAVVREEVVSLTLYERAVGILSLFLSYMKMLIVPVGQNALRVMKPASSVSEPYVLAGAAVSVALIAAVFLLRRKKALCFSLVWVALPLAPVLLFMPVLSKASLAERYLYLSTAGFGLFLAALAARLSPEYRKPAFAAAAALLVVYAAGTVNRNRVWENDVTLWSDVVAKSPGNIYGHFELANAYLSAGDRMSAMAGYRKVLELNPAVAQAHYNMGVIYLQESLLEEAASSFITVLRIDPGHKEARQRLQEIQGALAFE